MMISWGEGTFRIAEFIKLFEVNIALEVEDLSLIHISEPTRQAVFLPPRISSCAVQPKQVTQAAFVVPIYLALIKFIHYMMEHLFVCLAHVGGVLMYFGRQ